MDLKQYLDTGGGTGKKIIMSVFAKRIRRAQSIVSRLAAKKHFADPDTAVNIVIATKGVVSLDDLYDTPPKYRADRARQ